MTTGARLFVAAGALSLLLAGCGGSAAEEEGTDNGTQTADVADDGDLGAEADEAAHEEDETHDESDEAAHEEDETHDESDEAADIVVAVSMTEMAFTFDEFDVSVGQTVRFDFVNDGAVEHEAMFGDAHQQEEFAEAGGHSDHDGSAEEDHHGTVHAVTLDAGGQGSLTITFDEPGEMIIGCHLAGHWDGGMHASFLVV